jgi:hypothetical protein
MMHNIGFYDMNGCLINRLNIAGFEKTVPVSSWDKGAYFMKILFADGRVEHRKIIK